MKKTMYCPDCNEDVFPIEKNEIVTHIIKDKSFKLKEHNYYCPICTNQLINDDFDEKMFMISNEYLKQFGLSFNRLKEIRTSLHLTQELFAKALNWSKKSIVRYENAESLPQNEYMSVYQRLNKDINEFFIILKNNKYRLDKDTYYKIYNLANADISIKGINSLVYLLNSNNLNKTQIMKNTFALDTENFKKHSSYLSNNEYAHGFYGPIINGWEAYLYYMVRQGYIGFTATEDDIIFYTFEEPDLSLFTKEEIEVMERVKTKLKGKSASELTKWSHNYIGWKETKEGEIIDPKKYAKYFSLDDGWE